ncbi:MAG: hypothetical protein JEZ12_02870 [Desulfobacterium sp.]|nr:hypothetical protein [Desulfobacterium sp.]
MKINGSSNPSALTLRGEGIGVNQGSGHTASIFQHGFRKAWRTSARAMILASGFNLFGVLLRFA